MQSHIQFLEHLIPLVKLFSCLASGHESTRVLIGELTMCTKLIDFAIRLKSLGAEHENLVLKFQHSVVVLLHVLSRSFSLHHTFFRNQTIGQYILKLINDNLPNITEGSYLSAKLVEAASSTLVNQVLPMCPLKEVSRRLFQSDYYTDCFIYIPTHSTMSFFPCIIIIYLFI
ncbi:unnamed protein product [Trichobilharzia regenti]|nr:unnamed protein product [Trichobilharzia regenti]